MEILIGIRGNKNLLGFDVDMSENELTAKVNEALASDHGVLDLTDTKGQRTLVPIRAQPPTAASVLSRAESQ